MPCGLQESNLQAQIGPLEIQLLCMMHAHRVERPSKVIDKAYWVEEEVVKVVAAKSGLFAKKFCQRTIVRNHRPPSERKNQ
jgi:hypothetical protein